MVINEPFEIGGEVIEPGTRQTIDLPLPPLYTHTSRRLLASKVINRIHGTLLAVPVVNVYGFVQQSRYLPDRRDLNRSFPGSERGSMASRLAHTLMTEVIDKCTMKTHCHWPELLHRP